MAFLFKSCSCRTDFTKQSQKIYFIAHDNFYFWRHIWTWSLCFKILAKMAKIQNFFGHILAQYWNRSIFIL